MIKKILLFSLLFINSWSWSQDGVNIQDRMALKALVDRFSNLADTKEVSLQLELFTKDAVVESYREGKLGSRLEGHKQIGDAFRNFLNNFEVVFHQNGQQTVQIQGNKATGIAYCTVTLIANNNNQRIKTTFGIRYADEYEKVNQKWLIRYRQSHFLWEENSILD